LAPVDPQESRLERLAIDRDLVLLRRAVGVLDAEPDPVHAVALYGLDRAERCLIG
jgi:hypothetical protein